MKTFIRSTLRVSAISAVMLMANAALAQGVAFITDIRGDATLGAGKAALMAEVGKGARIACMKECQVGIMYLVSGKEFTLKGPGDFAVGEVEVTAKIGPPPTVRETAWKVSSQTVSQAVQTSNASIRMRSVGATAKGEEKPAMERLLYPVQTNVVSLQPVFRWTADSPRGPFDFELKSVGATAKTIYKAKAGDTMVKLPSSVKLQPESEYAWTVKMADKVADKVAGKEIGSGSFKTLPVASRELVQQRKPADKAEFSDWLLYGLTLRELGATQDAAEVFGKLARERADSPELAALAK